MSKATKVIIALMMLAITYQQLQIIDLRSASYSHQFELDRLRQQVREVDDKTHPEKIQRRVMSWLRGNEE